MSKKELPDTSMVDSMSHEQLERLALDAKLRRVEAQRVEAYVNARLLPEQTDDELRAAADRFGVSAEFYINAYRAGGGK